MTEEHCLSCRRCMPCPAGVDIPCNMALWANRGLEIQREWDAMHEYEQAGYCHGCGQCERFCPQRIPIRQRLRELQQQFGKSNK